MFKYLLKHYRGYLLGIVFLIITNLLAAYIPQLIKKAVDMIEIQDSALLEVLVWASCLAVLMAIMRAVSRQIVFAIGREIEFELKKDIFNHLVTLPPSFFSENSKDGISTQAGSLISIITNDVQSIRALGGFAMLNIFNTVIAFAVILPLMFDLHTELTWAFLALIPIVILFVISLSGKIKDYQNWVQEELARISNFIEQNLSGIHIIKAYAQEQSELKRFSVINDQLKQAYMKLIQVRSFIGPVMRVIASLGFVLLLYMGGKSIIAGEFSAGDFAAYALYVQRLIWPVATLGWLITIIYRAQVSEKRINGILQVDPTIKDRDNAIQKTNFETEIEIKSLNTKITKGTMVGVVGAIGSGKTILAHKLMHLKELADDEILIDGIDIKDIQLNSLRTLVNLVPQTNFLFSSSVFDNIAYAKDLTEAEVIDLAKKVNIHDEIVSLPEGYDSVVGERGVTLSGGQRQRMAIARALAIDPEILVLDDSLSSLDNESSKLILHNIIGLRKNKTTIFITHNESILTEMDQLIKLERADD